jgi:hypothetical protein
VVAVANEITDFIGKVIAFAKNEQNTRAAITSVMAVHKPRIFEKGLDRNGSQIGVYSTTPISISKKNQARQTGHTYFKGGYDEYKRDIGKNPGFVNLRNTDQMMQDYGIVGSGQSLGFGFQNKNNADKSQWLQDKYDRDIFDLSDGELEVLVTVLETKIASI